MGSCEIRFLVKQDYHILNPLPSLFHMHLAETKGKEKLKYKPERFQSRHNQTISYVLVVSLLSVVIVEPPYPFGHIGARKGMAV